MKQENNTNIDRRLKAVINTVIDGVITIDKDGIIETANPAAARLFEYNVDDLIGKNVSILMPDPHQSAHDGYLRAYLQTREAKIIGIGREVRGKKKDGRTFPMRLAVSEVLLDDDTVIFTGIIHDLTDVKKAEEALVKLNHELEEIIAQRTEKLKEVINKLLDLNHKYGSEIDHRKKVEEALLENQAQLKRMLDREKELNDLKSRFLSMASHEFKTPLSTILSSASLIRRYSLDEHLSKREKHIDRIKNSVEHLDAILNDFLSLSKLEENKIEVNHDEILVSELFQEIQDELTDQLKNGQSLIYSTHAKTPLINSDKRILKNILFNLISNASKYSDEDKPILCKMTERDDFIEISIRDEGMGIPEEEQKHLFTRFFRASNAINIKGTGLGLHIVQQYLNLLGGSITFESKQSQGSTFTISLKKERNGQYINH